MFYILNLKKTDMNLILQELQEGKTWLGGGCSVVLHQKFYSKRVATLMRGASKDVDPYPDWRLEHT